jgi:cobalamin biosynthesis protein CobD/CbiB
MLSLETYRTLLLHRVDLLTVLVLVGLCASPLAERGPFANLVQAGRTRVLRLSNKLNREQRSPATLVYRGIVALLMLLLPACIVGLALATPALWSQLVIMLSMVLWFGYCFAATSTLALWQSARANRLALELPHLDFLFADGHAVIRYVIALRMEAFAVGIVGAGCWYVVSGWMGMALYLTLAAANAAYGQSLAFGWAARSLFRLADFLPRAISRILIAVAALATPHCRPVASILASSWRKAVAKTLCISLGGVGPHGAEPWMGSGKARLTHQHLRRTLYLLGVATLLFMALLQSHKALFLIGL